MYRKILLAYDGSTEGRRALREGAAADRMTGGGADIGPEGAPVVAVEGHGQRVPQTDGAAILVDPRTSWGGRAPPLQIRCSAGGVRSSSRENP